MKLAVVVQRYGHAIAGGAEAHDLADRDGEVGVAFDGLIAPAAGIVLTLAGELDDFFEFFANGRVDIAPLGHAIDLGEEEGGEAVAVHVVLTGTRNGNIAGVLDARANELDRAVDVFAKRALTRRTAG